MCDRHRRANLAVVPYNALEGVVDSSSKKSANALKQYNRWSSRRRKECVWTFLTMHTCVCVCKCECACPVWGGYMVCNAHCRKQSQNGKRKLLKLVFLCVYGKRRRRSSSAFIDRLDAVRLIRCCFCCWDEAIECNEARSMWPTLISRAILKVFVGAKIWRVLDVIDEMWSVDSWLYQKYTQYTYGQQLSLDYLFLFVRIKHI